MTRLTTIRCATADDAEHLRRIESAAGRLFSEIGMHAVAGDAPPSVGELLEFVDAGRAFVAADDEDVPVGYVVFDHLDECVHVEQVSVDPELRGLRVGRDLLDRVAEWGAARGAEGLTLTTFRDVPWNAPYYARLGFRVLAEDELSPGLRRLLDGEQHLEREGPRVAMRRELGRR